MINALIYTFQSYIEGLKYFFNRKIIFYIFLILLIGGITAFYTFTLVWNESDSLLKMIIGNIDWISDRGYLSTAFEWIIKIFGSAFILILYRYFFYIICSPILSLISEEIERLFYLSKGIIAPKNELPLISSFWRSLRMNGRNLFIELSITVILFLLSIIPIVGFIFAAISSMVSAYFIGVSNFDISVERYYKFDTSLIWYSMHRFDALFQGIVYMIIFWIPVIGWMAMPIISTMTTTIHFCKLFEASKTS
ncbi:MAG TPA: EI24 domain-containing protein [Saprospiraceae bacterium]|nr:EI24 domain-containing protein [Saprospiraceae bacterium]